MALTKVTERIISDNLSISGIATASNFKTGTTNVHNVGVEVAGINVLGGDTPIGTGSTIWKDGGALFSGIVTATSFVGDIAGNVTGNISGGTVAGSTGTFSSDVTISGDLGVAGTLTYEDVARVDAIGLSTYREGLHIGPLAGIALTAYKDGSIRTTGVITATTYYGSGANLTGIDATQIVTGNTSVQTVDTGSNGHVKVTTEGSERLRILSDGKVGIGSDNPDVKLTVCASSGDSYIRTIGGINQGLLLSNSAGTLIGGFASGGALGGGVSDVGVRVESGNNILFSHGSTIRLRIDSNGDLGLGIAAVPQDSGAKTLHIHHPTVGNPARAAVRLTTGTSGSASSNGAFLGIDYSNYLYLYNHENGFLRFGTNNTTRWNITNDGHFRPEADNSYDIGASNQRARNIYTADLQLSNEGSLNDVDGTWGNYTIQEGENDLFLINNRSGKKYKFKLEELI